MKKSHAAFIIAIWFLFSWAASASSHKNSAPSYTVKCSNQETQPFCKAPTQHADLGYRVLAEHLPRCEGDCDLDWLGNDNYNKRNATNNVYSLSPDTYLLTHEDAPLGAYGGGAVSIFFITRTEQSMRFTPLLTEKGEPIIGDRRSWFYDPEQKLIGYSPITNSVGMCGRTYFYTLSSNKLKLKNITIHKEMLHMPECRDVKEELAAYPPHIIVVEDK